MQQDNLRHNTMSAKKDKSGAKDYSKVTMNFSSNVQIQKQKVPVAFQGVFDKFYSKLFVEKNPNSNFAKDFLNKPTTGIDLCEMNQQLANDMLVDEKYKDMKNYNSVEEAEAVRNKSFMNTKEFYRLSEYIVSNELKNSLTGLEAAPQTSLKKGAKEKAPRVVFKDLEAGNAIFKDIEFGHVMSDAEMHKM